MALNFAQALLSATLVSSAGILLVALLRKPLRMATGAQAAYWLWLLVPASVLATWIPVPSHTLLLVISSLPSYLSAALHSRTTTVAPPSGSGYITAVVVMWAVGAAIAFALMLIRQLRFARSLGAISSDATGIGRSRSISTPMLVGVWRPKIVVPIDFQTRYSIDEQVLVLEHERAHWDRGDIVINALSAAWLCLSWFNPLTYWAFGLLRLDQELACDALVLQRSKSSPRCYAGALLKTQLATQAAWLMPVGCHWQSIHPLKERVAMLKRPLPGLLRRMAGFALALMLTLLGAYTVWATAVQPPSQDWQVLVHLRLTVTSVSDTTSQATEFLANSAEPVSFGMGTSKETRCVVFLPRILGGSLAWDKHPANTQPGPEKKSIWLECMLRNNGQVVATPALITLDSEPGSVDFYNTALATHYLFEITATTSKEQIAAARQANGGPWFIPSPNAAGSSKP